MMCYSLPQVLVLVSNCFIHVSITVDPEPISGTLEVRTAMHFALYANPSQGTMHTHSYKHRDNLNNPPFGMFLVRWVKIGEARRNLDTYRVYCGYTVVFYSKIS